MVKDPNYNHVTGANDIGIVVLSKSLKYTKSIQPIRVRNGTFSDSLVTLSGFGLYSGYRRSGNNPLQIAKLRVVNKNCNRNNETCTAIIDSEEQLGCKVNTYKNLCNIKVVLLFIFVAK